MDQQSGSIDASESPVSGVSSGVRLQVRTNLISILGMVAVVLGVGSLLLYFRQRTTIDPGSLLADPTALAGQPWYTGLISSAGILLMCAAATASIFGGALLWRSPPAFERSRFLVFFGIFSGVLALDDQFLLHEELGELFATTLGIGAREGAAEALQSLTYLVYGFSVAFLVWRYRFTVARTNYLLVALGVLAFAGSVVLDVAMPLVPIQRLEDPWLHSIYVGVEDLLKLAGILFWSTYLVQTGFNSVNNALAKVNAE